MENRHQQGLGFYPYIILAIVVVCTVLILVELSMNVSSQIHKPENIRMSTNTPSPTLQIEATATPGVAQSKAKPAEFNSIQGIAVNGTSEAGSD
jgi:hypothetical protein